MTSLALENPTIWNRIEEIWHRNSRSYDRANTPDSAHEDAHIRQDFIFEMLNPNPEAFQNKLDVQCMMGTFPGRF